MIADLPGAQPGLPLAHDWHAARGVAATAASALRSETVPLEAGIGRILTRDLLALSDVPHYASSAMDGWAVSGTGPWRLTGESTLDPGFAATIVTGGLVPPGADAVLRSESGIVAEAVLASTSSTGEPHPGQHIRMPGREARCGEIVVSAGTLLNPAHIALAAGCGHDRLDVIRRPRVLLLLTGDEVDEHGIPGPGRVRDSFGPQLPGVLRMLGAEVVSQQRVRDDFAATVEGLEEHSGSIDVVVTTGGTGDSASDHLRAALRSLDAEFLVHRVAMRPGGPTTLARMPDGRLVLGLPGNPLAAMMGLLTLAVPLLAGLQGRASALGRVESADRIEGRDASSILVPFRTVDGRGVANPWLGSGMMRGLADADGVLVVPPGGVGAGDRVETVPLPWR
ncbi:molybdopterin molybdotransferase MoeA [Glaciihabitans sp. INWT7]|uniref:molybdopterin molybdotransferase MoeA n=1 Tax=Glaciihabitans sp. INWT7 TaxID=2596912 RepID=UPI00162A3584|nr:molybdopterin molybdotransferase MoeA [Glaciihabitans sp. INWT7]